MVRSTSENKFPQNGPDSLLVLLDGLCVATPFFIGSISKGRTIKNIVLGGYGMGIRWDIYSVYHPGNYGLAQQLKHGVDITGILSNNADYAQLF